MASHRRAAFALHTVVHSAWARIRSAVAGRGAVHEADAQEWIAGLFAEAGLVTDGAALVAAGEASGDPHYEPVGRGRRLAPGDVVQLDLWAREPGERSVYADISWVGVLAARPTAEQERVFAAVVSPARPQPPRSRPASPPGFRVRTWIGRSATSSAVWVSPAGCATGQATRSARGFMGTG